MSSKRMTSAKKTAALRLSLIKLKEIESAFNDIWRFSQKIQESTTATQIQLRLEKIDELWERYSVTLVEIKSHGNFDDEDDEYEKERQNFSDRYYQAKSILTDQFKERQAPTSLNQSVHVGETAGTSTFEHVRLPQIKLQSFNGEIEEWLGFRDLFTSLIHWKTDLPEVEKFHYLKGCLQGEPRTLIDSLPLTAANYQVAWAMLLKRYNNSKQLKKRQVQTLLKLPSLAKESAVDLHSLLEGFEKTVQILDQIVQPVDYKDLLLVNLLTSRLDPSTRRSWEEYSSTKEQDTLKELTEFLHRRVQVLESVPMKNTEVNKSSHHQQPPSKPRVKTSFNTAQASGGRCLACTGNHPIFLCTTFQRMSLSERDSLIRSHYLCRNCFRPGHQAKDCQSKYSCRNCKGRHHSLICFKSDRDASRAPAKGSNALKQGQETAPIPTPSTSNSNASQADNSVVTPTTNSMVAGTAHQCSSTVLLATAVVILQDDDGNRVPARALLDSGSESNFISEHLSQRLKVARQKVDISVLGIGQVATKVKQRIAITIRSRVSEFSCQMHFLVLPRVTTNLPTTKINTVGWTIPEGIQLADPSFFVSSKVDLVLGIEAFFDFFGTGKTISLGERLPALHDSVFGWVISGRFPEVNCSPQINCNVASTKGLEELLSRFWSMEEVDSTKIHSPEESRCEEIFASTVERGSDGRYTVSLLKDENAISRLGESKEIALRRFHGTERRLSRDVKLREQYVAFMEEYIQLDHMRKIEGEPGTEKRCFLPHHPVIKEASTTTKVRVVFDASCKTSTGLSLNDVLLAGPVIQQDLRAIIIRCCTMQILLVADAEKMFRQIFVHRIDRPFQSILWRSSPSEEVGIYELNTVTYGTRPAPFLATRTLQQLATDEGSRYPLAAKAIIEDTYMDDVITGCDNLEEAKELQVQLNQMMNSGGFQLRKWASNRAEVLHGISEKNLAIPISSGINLDPDTSVKALGLTWLPHKDVFRFQFEVAPVKSDEVLTKRKVLSIIATLFDPLGFIGATTTAAKIYMQLLWTLEDGNGKRLEWDQPLPATVGESWRNFHSQLPALNEIQIDRCVIIPRAVQVEIHCFSDASQKAYGGCLYMRSEDQEGNVRVRLLTSKSKVAPLKTQTIPRLELCGALLAAQVYEKVRQATNYQVRTTFWVDSTCALHWIQSTPSTWSVYVGNRVAKIQEITEGCEWRHVAGADNPADLISRGISANEIVHNKFWWNGPGWLAEDRENWPKSTEPLPGLGEEQEKRTTTAVNSASAIQTFIEDYIGRFSSYSDLIRCTAIWLRFFKLLRQPKDQQNAGFLTTSELKEAEYTLIRRIQQHVFKDEWKALIRGEAVGRRSALRWFHPFVSEDGVIRVGGRLRNSNETRDVRHPIVIPARHRFTRLLLEYYHKRLLHAGPHLLLSVVRQRFWPLGGRSMAKQIVHQCHRCFRCKPTPIQQFMADLPAARVTVARPFLRTGVDYFGPIYVRPAPRRPAVKAYGAIFICLTTKAVHIELVSDLTTERFLQAMRRFVARRGKCAEMFSDNGTNFVGARNRLQELFSLLKQKGHHEKINNWCNDQGIRWNFNPPNAPHFGGLWEAAVRSTKHHLRRVIGDTPVSQEDMQTLLAQVESCLNSRPLTALSDDPNELEALTPGHFLIGSALESLPDVDVTEIPSNRLKQWELTQRMLQQFWKRWRVEYLSQLQGRQKRWRPPVNVEKGKLVVICDDNQPPTQWKLGRIEEVHPGQDGIVRVVTLKTATGSLKRPVERVCLLPEPITDESYQPENQDQ